MNICVYLIAKGFYWYKNKKRDQVWNAMTEEVSHSGSQGFGNMLTMLVGTYSLSEHDQGQGECQEGLPLRPLSIRSSKGSRRMLQFCPEGALRVTPIPVDFLAL